MNNYIQKLFTITIPALHLAKPFSITRLYACTQESTPSYIYIYNYNYIHCMECTSMISVCYIFA